MFSFGQFPGVTVLITDVSEPSISSIFIGRWMKYAYECSDISIDTPLLSELDLDLRPTK